ncbi:MAG: aminotransferase class I/II-fold pyridoxal phosphate-dependent enzyme, partial [Desulfosporosinus sp.]
VEALVNRAKHGIYGYSDGMDGYYEALIDWMQERHGWEIQRDWISFSPGIVPAINELIRSLTKPRDKILVQFPVYPPFFYCGRINRSQNLGICFRQSYADYVSFRDSF